MVYKFFDKKSKGSGVNIEVTHAKQIAKELQKPIIRNINKRTVYSGFKDWFKDNNIEMHSIHNKGKSVVAERFIRILKNKIFKHMTFQRMFILMC